MVRSKMMKHAIELAKLGRGSVSPNPEVGAVLVRDGQIFSEAYHAQYGEAHAEIRAIRKADPEKLKGCDLYVNLEPCSHHGKTPPCADEIIRAGIGRVIYGMKDPNPLVEGKGLEKLRDAGIEVIGPLMEDKCRRLNRGFIHTVTKRRPFITVKVAQTMDGKIALSNGESGWITGRPARKRVHQMRAEHDAVLVGSHTVILDDPELNVRLTEGVHPRKIILDTRLTTPMTAGILRENPEKTIIVHGENADKNKKDAMRELGVRLIQARQKNERIDVPSVCSEIIHAGVTSILVEGGSKIFAYFLNLGWIDQLCIFVAPKLFGQGVSAFEDLEISAVENALNLQNVKCTQVGKDYLFEGTVLCSPD